MLSVTKPFTDFNFRVYDVSTVSIVVNPEFNFFYFL